MFISDLEYLLVGLDKTVYRFVDFTNALALESLIEDDTPRIDPYNAYRKVH